MLDNFANLVYNNIAVIDGELAVPCNLQSAIARLNTLRGKGYGRQSVTSGVDGKVLCNAEL